MSSAPTSSSPAASISPEPGLPAMIPLIAILGALCLLVAADTHSTAE